MNCQRPNHTAEHKKLDVISAPDTKSLAEHASKVSFSF